MLQSEDRATYRREETQRDQRERGWHQVAYAHRRSRDDCGWMRAAGIRLRPTGEQSRRGESRDARDRRLRRLVSHDVSQDVRYRQPMGRDAGHGRHLRLPVPRGASHQTADRHWVDRDVSQDVRYRQPMGRDAGHGRRSRLIRHGAGHGRRSRRLVRHDVSHRTVYPHPAGRRASVNRGLGDRR